MMPDNDESFWSKERKQKNVSAQEVFIKVSSSRWVGELSHDLSWDKRSHRGLINWHKQFEPLRSTIEFRLAIVET